MDTVELILRGKARGIDFQHVAGIASNLDGIAQERLRTKEERKLHIPVKTTVNGKETRTYRRPTWSAAELGQAAAGMNAIQWSAAMYSLCGAKDGYFLLWDALVNESQRLAKRENWPARVKGEDGQPQCFREELSDLVLFWDANQNLFAQAPRLYSVFMKVSDDTWERQLQDPFASLKAAYNRWLGQAKGVIRKWITEE
jgi:hypothetical protein